MATAFLAPGGIALALALDLSACTNPYDPRPASDRWLYLCGSRRGIRWHRRRGNHSATATAILNGSRERHHHRVIGQRGPLGARYLTSGFDVADASHGLTQSERYPVSCGARASSPDILTPLKIRGDHPAFAVERYVISRRPSWQTRASIAMRCL